MTGTFPEVLKRGRTAMLHYYAKLDQLGEQLTVNQRGGGSSPPLRAIRWMNPDGPEPALNAVRGESR